ncbi:hypothetical protein GCM10027270_24590 [Nocardioides ginkgobilobae]
MGHTPARTRRSLAASAVGALTLGALTFAGPATAPARADDGAGPTATPAAAKPGRPGKGVRSLADHALRPAGADQNFYFVMGDRFANGDPANDTGGIEGGRLEHGFDPSAKGFYHGGDLAGLTEKLDYVQGLGTDAIWLTPIFKNKAVQLEDGPSAGYHGYWITDFTQVDPHLGTNEELAALVDAAHARGMKVYFDIITNHTADVIGYEEGARTAYVDKDVEPYRTAAGDPFDDRDFAGTDDFPLMDPATSFPYTPVLEEGEEDLKVPAWLNDPSLYHNRGNTTFVGEDSQYGDFFGLDDLFTEHPTVRDGMIDIYRTWVGEFGIDGFRIDTMKHVDDEFWKAFGPGLLDYARANGKPDFFMFGEVALDGSDAEATSFTSHYTTHLGMQAILDFPFQWAARDFISRQGSAAALRDFFLADDWYTDADSNASVLPTFLGNHDMGRIGHFLGADDPDATAEVKLARSRLAHDLLYLSRGNPVVFYGDEQGFTGTGGDQLARQDMFPSTTPEYVDDEQLGSSSTPAEDNFDTDHPLYQHISGLAALREEHPALSTGAMQVRTAEGGALVFSRIDAEEQVEYVVAVNNSEEPARVTTSTFAGGQRLERIYGEGPDRLRTDRRGEVSLEVPATGSVVYRATAPLPASRTAPKITLRAPAPSQEAHSRYLVQADLRDYSSFAEVTFLAREPGEEWTPIGTDDSAPYRVFHDLYDAEPGTRVQYRAVVLDNAGHTRASEVRRATVAPPRLEVTTSGSDGSVTAIDPVRVSTVPDPEHPDQVVTFERRVGDGSWTEIGTDSSSPVYTVDDDVSELDLGTSVSYRASMVVGDRVVRSRPVTVVTAAPTPARESVTVAGSLQSEIGCPDDWQPGCTESRLEFDETDGLWRATFTLPEGEYEWKVAVDGSWDENYGAGGAAGGDNLSLSVPAGGGDYTFTWDQVSKVPAVAPAG